MSLSQYRNRGRAYKCKRCTKVQRKGRMVAHVLKHHVPFDRVPFACSLCGFRCMEKQALMDHITKYSRHREEETRYGTPDYKKILLRATNPYEIGDDDMEQLSKDDSLRWHARNQISESADDGECPFEEDEEVVSGGLVFPQWMSDTLTPGKVIARTTPPVVQIQQTVTPMSYPQLLPQQLSQQLPQLSQHDLAEITLRSNTQPLGQRQTVTSLQNNQQYLSNLSTINRADLFNIQAPVPQRNLNYLCNQKSSNHTNNIVPVNNTLDTSNVTSNTSTTQSTVLNTPEVRRVTPAQTPCLDEVVVQENYLNDPLFDEIPSTSSSTEPPTKRQKITNDQQQQTENPGASNQLSDVIMNAAKMIAEAINSNTSAIKANEKSLSKIGDELVRVERKLSQIERVCTITQQQQQMQKHFDNSENKENKSNKGKQPLKSVVKKL